MRHQSIWLVGVSLMVPLMLSSAACLGPRGAADRSLPGTSTPGSAPAPRSASQSAENVARLAVDNLSARLGVPPQAIEVVDVQSVAWPDASLGCPEPGATYDPIEVSGFALRLKAAGAEYEYHTDLTDKVILCEERSPLSTPPTGGAVEPGLGSLVRSATEDLADRLGTDAAEIEVVEARSVIWPDGSLGCPQPGMSYIQVQVDGVLIRLEAAGQVYQYHGGGGRDPFLCDQLLQVPFPPVKRGD